MEIEGTLLAMYYAAFEYVFNDNSEAYRRLGQEIEMQYRQKLSQRGLTQEQIDQSINEVIDFIQVTWVCAVDFMNMVRSRS
jgi:hypothetical protein